MSAFVLLAQAGSLRGAEICPHPERLESCAIRVDANKPFVCCPTCKASLEQLISDWHAGGSGPRTVYAQMFVLGYTRRDALRFIAQLFKDRIRIRLGLLRPEAI